MRKRLGRIFRAIGRFFRRVDSGLDGRPWLFFGTAAVLFFAAGFIRFWAAPISAGPDVGQFWGFARLFQMHGLDFYRYADGYNPALPVQGWGFVYPPVWLLILRVALLAAPGSTATSDMVDSSWRLAMKTPVIAADLAIGCLLMWAVPGSKTRKLLLGALWLCHPTGWYNSAIFGQFDAIAAAFLLASLILLLQGRDRLGFVLGGLAILTKQHAALPFLLMAAVLARRIGWRRIAVDTGILAGMGVAISVPFVLHGNFTDYARAVLFPAQAPAYQLPLVFAFSGSGSLLTYFNQAFGWDTAQFLNYSVPVLIALVLVASLISYFKPIRLEQAALAGILLFVGVFYRVNYQYLVIYLPIAILALAFAQGWFERVLTLLLIAIPAAWVWLFDISFWFWYQIPRLPEAPPIFKTLGFTHYLPDIAFVVLAAVLMGASLAYAADVLRQRQTGPLGWKSLAEGPPGQP